jgi:predicted GIY-YIG superfamily endonuclease
MEYSIYCFTNLLNNKSYIGLTKDLKARRYSHLKQASYGSQCAFHRAIRKYGIDNFSFVVLETCGSLEEANEAESFYISLFRTMTPNGYNLTGGGEYPNLSEEFLQKISGDNANNKKITSAIASQLYDEYQNDVTISTYDLSRKYGIVDTMINNIIHKKAWKSANKTKPDIDFSLRIKNQCSDKSKNKRITSAIAREVYQYRLNNKCSLDDLASTFGLTRDIIFGVLSKKNWKDATSDLPNIDFKKEGYEVRSRSKLST